MDAKETIGRAVAKVKGECWHEGMQHTKMWGGMHYVDRCRKCGGTVSLGHPDYTSESNIREAVRVLCDTNRRFSDFQISLLRQYQEFTESWESPFRPNEERIYFDYWATTAPAEVLVEALLSIAEEVLKEGEGPG